MCSRSKECKRMEEKLEHNQAILALEDEMTSKEIKKIKGNIEELHKIILSYKKVSKSKSNSESNSNSSGKKKLQEELKQYQATFEFLKGNVSETDLSKMEKQLETLKDVIKNYKSTKSKSGSSNGYNRKIKDSLATLDLLRDELTPSQINIMEKDIKELQIKLKQYKTHKNLIGDDKNIQRGCVGIDNPGNQCYLIATLQMLSNCELLTDIIQMQNSEPNLLIMNFKSLLDTIWSRNNGFVRFERYSETPKSGKVTPGITNIKQIISNRNDIFNNWMQQDCSEFLQFFIEVINGEIIDNMINLIFELAITSNNHCNTCNSEKIKVKAADTELILYLPSKNIPTTIETLIQSKFKEYIGDPFFCNSCHNNREHTSLDLINQFPDFLVIRLNRFKYNRQTNKLDKLKNNITMNDEIDLTPYRFVQGTTQKYQLVAITYHLGYSPISGHYISECLNKHNNQWYRYNDTNVTRISKPTKSNNCYILLYKFIV